MGLRVEGLLTDTPLLASFLALFPSLLLAFSLELVLSGDTVFILALHWAWREPGLNQKLNQNSAVCVLGPRYSLNLSLPSCQMGTE